MATRNTAKDHLSTLPSDIQHIVFSHLTFKERWHYASVCNDWRSAILEWQGMWESLSMDDGHNIVPDLLPYRSCIRGSVVKQIRVQASYDRDHSTAVINFLTDLNCDAIEEDFLKLIGICGSTLTRVSIAHDEEDQTNTTPDMILCYCPNLRHLSYYGFVYGGEQNKPQLAPSFKHQHLVDLSLEFCNIDKEGSFDPLPFLRTATNLQRLSLCLCNIVATGHSLPSLLREHCPKLVSLFLAGYGDGGTLDQAAYDQCEWKSKTVKNLSTTKPISSSLERLALHDSQDFYNGSQDLLCAIARDYRESLKFLDLKGATLTSESVFGRLSVLVFPSLKRQSTTILEAIGIGAKSLETLELNSCVSITADALAKLLTVLLATTNQQTAPLLRSIKFNQVPAAVTPQVLDVIAEKSMNSNSTHASMPVVLKGNGGIMDPFQICSCNRSFRQKRYCSGTDFGKT
ncbi:hypothetical protein BDB00DRAFT_880680 [Zychaea mexicana]|uniref:uncharacterized protein n=1 Tax=Zychaea mexicana TaxID=64656 RepID=UPI0022FE6BB2|nr:uncharacterized protein BDB00DRAFT_880680 [Zychaea mexicana]KAI9466398.1 hypothetical protein BDB00DRAFT_880680 [Zychaea mexicana]